MKFFPLVKKGVFERRLMSVREKIELGFLNGLAVSVNIIMICLNIFFYLITILGAISAIVLLYIVAKDQYLILMNMFMPFIKLNGSVLNLAINVAALAIIVIIASRTYKFMDDKFLRRRK